VRVLLKLPALCKLCIVLHTRTKQFAANTDHFCFFSKAPRLSAPILIFTLISSWITEATQYKIETIFFNRNVKKSVRQVKPDILVYNAGTDILEGDPLGILAISPWVCNQKRQKPER
jgi:hypothetical protein